MCFDARFSSGRCRARCVLIVSADREMGVWAPVGEMKQRLATEEGVLGGRHPHLLDRQSVRAPDRGLLEPGSRRIGDVRNLAEIAQPLI
jgi:hypothetical protein